MIASFGASLFDWVGVDCGEGARVSAPPSGDVVSAMIFVS
jgi:hypothetical protein